MVQAYPTKNLFLGPFPLVRPHACADRTDESPDTVPFSVRLIPLGILGSSSIGVLCSGWYSSVLVCRMYSISNQYTQKSPGASASVSSHVRCAHAACALAATRASLTQ